MDSDLQELPEVSDSSDRKIKVTDRRLFTPDGELREEYRGLEEEVPADSPRADEASSAAIERGDEASEARSGASPRSEPEKGPDRSPLEGKHARPTVFDLIGVVAQPIALYLGDARMPDGESMENLELARLYIDLLEVLQDKTAGNLSQNEAVFLSDLLYQLRLRFVEKRKQGGTL